MTIRKLNEIFERNNMTTKYTIYHIANDFKESGSISDMPKHGRTRIARPAESLTAAQERKESLTPFLGG